MAGNSSNQLKDNHFTVTTTILSSTFFLTLLLAVGLFFFIRASVKDRTEQVKLIVSEPEESLLERFQAYFDQRSYRIAALDRTTGQVTFQGFVRPSWFLAIFLTILAACCILCFSLVLSILYPTVGKLFLALILLSPGAGVFYWQGAGRTEEVCLKVEPFCDRAAGTECHRQQDTQSLITVTAHRDELEQLQQTLKLQPLPESYPS